MPNAGERSSQTVDAIGKWVDVRNHTQDTGEMAQWIEGAGEKEHRHHQEIRGEVKTLHVFDH